jgi:hypothetical protein
MQNNTKAISFGVVPLTIGQSLLAVLPFLLFGVASMLARVEGLNAAIARLPVWQATLLQPFLAVYWLILIGLAAGIVADFPRWAFSYLGWGILYAWWWTGMVSYGFAWKGQMWIPLMLAIVAGLIIRRSLQPVRMAAANLWNDLTLLPFGLFILYAFVVMLADENHNPYLLWLMAAWTLAGCAGAWAFFRIASPIGRAMALVASAITWVVMRAINNATWDFRAYYNLPADAYGINLAALVPMVAILLAVVFALAYLTQRRQRRAIT